MLIRMQLTVERQINVSHCLLECIRVTSLKSNVGIINHTYVRFMSLSIYIMFNIV